MIDIYCLACYFSVTLVLRDRIQKQEAYRREKNVRLLFRKYNLQLTYNLLPNINHSGEAD